MWEISHPLANGASLGSYFCVKDLTSALKHYLSFCQRCPKFFFSPFCSASPEIIGGQSLSQSDRQTNTLTLYTGVCRFFPSVKFATSVLALLAGG